MRHKIISFKGQSILKKKKKESKHYIPLLKGHPIIGRIQNQQKPPLSALNFLALHTEPVPYKTWLEKVFPYLASGQGVTCAFGLLRAESTCLWQQ